MHEHPPGTPPPAEREGDDGPFLIDGCPRCEEYADELGVHFDPGRWRAFWAKMHTVEFQNTGGYQSILDKQLGQQLYYVALGLQRAFGIRSEALRFPGAFTAGLLIIEGDAPLPPDEDASGPLSASERPS